MESLIGVKFGQYEIIALIGEGGMGQVYRARDTRLAREVAIKLLPPELARDGEFVERFKREANTAASLDHPNVITIYNVDSQQNLHYIVMRLASGQTLRDLIQHAGPLPPARVLKIVEQLASALDYAHQRSIIHRDIKPANIMVGQDDRVTLMDFGIAKALTGSKLTRTGQMIGTPEYMAPEQFTGDPIDARSDLYALSVVIYEMLAGQVPFSGETPASFVHGHVYQLPPSPCRFNPQISPAVEQAVLCGLAKKADQRYQSAPELYQTLHAASAGGQIQAAPADPPAPLKLVTADGQEHPLPPGVTCLGRTSESDVRLNEGDISRHHAEIHRDAQGIAVVDLGSTNGTMVNGQRLSPHTPHPLLVGAQVQLGSNILLTVSQGAARQATAPAAPPAPPLPTSLASTGEQARSNAKSPAPLVWILGLGSLAALLFLCAAIALLLNKQSNDSKAPTASTAPTTIAQKTSTSPQSTAPPVSASPTPASEAQSGTPTASLLPTLPVQTGVPPVSAIPATLVPSPTPPSTPTPCAIAVYGGFNSAWQSNAEQLGCPSAHAQEDVWMAREDFERGLMLWREDNDRIYAIHNNGVWQNYNNTWSESEPEFSCGGSTSPPTPKRGFGKVWCSYSEVRQGLGNASNAEWGESGVVQNFQSGHLLKTVNGRLYVLFNDKTWR